MIQGTGAITRSTGNGLAVKLIKEKPAKLKKKKCFLEGDEQLPSNIKSARHYRHGEKIPAKDKMSTLHVRTGRIPNSYKTRNRRKKHLKQVFNFIYFICAMARYTATVPTATTAQRRYIGTISSSAVFTSVPGLVPRWRPTGNHCIACKKRTRRKKNFLVPFFERGDQSLQHTRICVNF